MKSLKYLIPLVFVLAFLYWTQGSRKEEQLPVMGKFTQLNLETADGSKLTGADLIGKVSAVNFFFTSCKMICPMTMANISSVQQSLSQEDDVVFFSISIDPKRDTPEKLAAFAQKFPGEKDNWIYLRGDRSEVGRILVEEFKLADSESPDFHTTKVMLIDNMLNIRGYYDAKNRAELDKLRIDIESLQRAR